MTAVPLICSGVAVRAGGATILRDLDLTVPAGRLTVLVGPSGAGKTTLLRAIAGFERPDAGTVLIGGRRVAGDGAWVEPEHRRIGMVFQEGALFPHLTVADNVGFGATGRERVGECLSLVGLADRARSFPHELSGGERQRVALARALVVRPKLLVADEPTAMLDASEQARMLVVLRERQIEMGLGLVLVSHDVAVVRKVTDRMVVLDGGRVVEEGPSNTVSSSPRSPTTRRLIDAAPSFAATDVDVAGSPLAVERRT